MVSLNYAHTFYLPYYFPLCTHTCNTPGKYVSPVYSQFMILSIFLQCDISWIIL